MIYREILAGCLRLQAERLLDWSQAEMTAAESHRDFDVEKVSRQETAWAIQFAEGETERLMALFIEQHEQEHGPIGDLEEALEREPGDFEMTPAMEDTIQRWSEFKEALLELMSVQRAYWGS